MAFRRRPEPAGQPKPSAEPQLAGPQPAEPQPAEPQPAEPLWRELVGDVLKDARTDRGETQRVVADRAGISVQYLSELERGRKEPSSEMLAAVGGALGLSLVDLTRGVYRRLGRGTARPTGPTLLLAA